MIGVREKWAVGRNLSARDRYYKEYLWHNNFMIPLLVSGTIYGESVDPAVRICILVENITFYLMSGVVNVIVS